MQVNSYFIPYFSATPLVHKFSEKVNKQIENEKREMKKKIRKEPASREKNGIRVL